MTGLLSIFSSSEDKVSNYIKDARQMGIQVLPPDVNTSGRGFTIDGDAIRFGLGAINQVGAASLNAIEEYRPYTSIEDMITRTPKKGLNKTNVKSLALSGALDELFKDYDSRLHGLQEIFKLRKDKDDLSWEIATYSEKAKLDAEKDLLGIYVSGHPLDRHADPVNWEGLIDNERVQTAGMVISYKQFVTKRGEDMAIVEVDTLEGPKTIVMFPDVYKKVQGMLAPDVIVKLDVYYKTNYQRNTRDIIVKDAKIPKRINKGVLQTLQPLENPAEALEQMNNIL